MSPRRINLMLRRQLVYVRDACVVLRQTAPRRVIFSFTTSEKVDLSHRSRAVAAVAAAARTATPTMLHNIGYGSVTGNCQ